LQTSARESRPERVSSGVKHVVAETSEARALARELLDYEIRVSDHASVLAGAFKTGAHDDLVTALGLAVLESGQRTSRITAAALAVNDRLVRPSSEGWDK
jgi:hypothetical protein